MIVIAVISLICYFRYIKILFTLIITENHMDITSESIPIPQRKVGRKSSIESKTSRYSSFGGSLPLEDSVDEIYYSSNSKSNNSTPKVTTNNRQQKVPTPSIQIDYPEDNNEYVDDQYDFDTSNQTPGELISSISKSKNGGNSNNRRVSFGKDTKKGSKAPLSTDKIKPVQTPDSRRSSFSLSTPGSTDFTRGHALPDESYQVDNNSEESDTDSEDKSGFTETSFINSIKKRSVDDSDDENVIMDYGDDDDDDDNDDEDRVRRSRRATKGKRFAFWKGERPVYEKGNIVGLLKAAPTPAKRKRETIIKDQIIKKKLTKNYSIKEESIENESEPIILPKGISYIDRQNGDELEVWDDNSENSKITRVVCYNETLQPPSALPITAQRPKGKNGVGFAAQSFNIPEIAGVMSGWITGFVELPGGAIKDAEGVGECTQVFTVAECQDGAVELGIADPNVPQWDDATAQRQLLNKGDTFYVPAGNIYRLENHAKSKSCMIYWTIIKPLEKN